MTIKADLMTSLYSHDTISVSFTGLSNPIKESIFSHWRLDPVYVGRLNHQITVNDIFFLNFHRK